MERLLPLGELRKTTMNGTDKDLSLHRGYCFVQYQTPEMAQAAADAENGRRVKQACLEVNIATITKDEVIIKPLNTFLTSKRPVNCLAEELR